MEENINEAYELVDENSVPRSANKIGSRELYKLKAAPESNVNMVMKELNVLHGKIGKYIYSVCLDYASANLNNYCF